MLLNDTRFEKWITYYYALIFGLIYRRMLPIDVISNNICVDFVAD